MVFGQEVYTVINSLFLLFSIFLLILLVPLGVLDSSEARHPYVPVTSTRMSVSTLRKVQDTYHTFIPYHHLNSDLWTLPNSQTQLTKTQFQMAGRDLDRIPGFLRLTISP